MLKDALDFLSGKFEAAAEPHLVMDCPHKVVYLIGNEPVTIDKPPPPRRHRVDTIESFVAAVRCYAAGGESTIWVGGDAAVLVIDDLGQRIDLVTLSLPITEVFKTLRKLDANRAWMEQKEFVRLLAVDLSDALHPTKLLNQVRRVRFETGQVVTAVRDRARESMGREINAAVQAAEGDLPERVECVVRVHDALGSDETMFAVPCAVEVDPGVGRFRLTPYPDALRRVFDGSLDQVAAEIDDRLEAAKASEDVPAVFRGSPEFERRTPF